MISPILFAGALLIEGAIFAALIAWLVHQANLRERDLLSRLMARDLTDYKVNTQPASQEPEGRRHNALVLQRQRREAGQNPLLRE